jgi:hypothetical protein
MQDMSEECKPQENIVANYRELMQTEGKKNKEKFNDTWRVQLKLQCKLGS